MISLIIDAFIWVAFICAGVLHLFNGQGDMATACFVGALAWKL